MFNRRVESRLDIGGLGFGKGEIVVEYRILNCVLNVCVVWLLYCYGVYGLVVSRVGV